MRLKEYDYSFPGWYFITICTFNKRNLFGNVTDGKMVLNQYGKIIEEEWLRTKVIRKNVDLDYYVIMPNHFHGTIIIKATIENVGATRRVAQKKEERAIHRIAPTNDSITLQSGSLGAIVGQFKSNVTKRIRKSIRNREIKIWQSNYYEHIIRNDLDLQNIRQYIELNPLRWELDKYFNLKSTSDRFLL